MSEKKKGTVSTAKIKSVTDIIGLRFKQKIRTPIVADDPMFIPEYKTDGAACCDLKANLYKTDTIVDPNSGFPPDKIVIPPFTTVKIDCGFSMAIPPGYEAQIRSRSGWSSKGLILSNGIGTIDDDFRLKICVILTNMTEDYFYIGHGERIAQMCIKPVFYFDFEPVESLSQTDRKGGFGSTGNK